MGDHVVACDVGGTTIRVGVANRAGQVLQLLSKPTPSSTRELVSEISSLAELAARCADLDPSCPRSIGVAVPAAINPGNGALGTCENLPAISGFQFRKEMEEAFTVPVVLENDANAAALGELRQGAAVGERDFILIIVGTGLGVGAVVGGRLLRGATGAAGEIGYLSFHPDLADAEDGNSSALYHSVSGPGIGQLAASMRASYPDTRIEPSASAAQIIDAAQANDPLGSAVLRRCVGQLSRVLGVVVAMLDPSLVLLGGGVGGNPAFVASVGQGMAGLLSGPAAIRAAALGDRAGIVGAAALAWEVADGTYGVMGCGARVPEATAGAGVARRASLDALR